MTHRRTKSPTGCRPAQLFGLWLIEPRTFHEVYARVRSVDLVALANVNARLRLKQMDDDEVGGPGGGDDDGDDDMPGFALDDDGIAHVHLCGPMTKYQTSFQSITGGTATVPTRRAVRNAMADDDVLGLMVHVDSPGGTADGTKELADDLAAFGADKPCMAFVDGLGCSAAYWCASACTMVYAGPMSLVGSIGTRLRLEDTSKEYEQAGVVVHEITTGPMKAAGADGTPITKAQIDYFQGIADDMQAFFAAGVKSGRRMSDDQLAAVSDGRVFIADKARQAGLVDKVATLDEAMSDLRTAAQARQQQRRTAMWFGPASGSTGASGQS